MLDARYGEGVSDGVGRNHLMITSETRNSLYNARHNYEAALNRKSGIGASRESLKNVLFNHYQDLIGLALGTKEMVDP